MLQQSAGESIRDTEISDDIWLSLFGAGQFHFRIHLGSIVLASEVPLLLLVSAS